MIIVLSPAKTLDFESPPATDKHTKPRFQSDARKLLADDPNLETDRGQAARVLLWLMEQDQAIQQARERGDKRRVNRSKRKICTCKGMMCH